MLYEYLIFRLWAVLALPREKLSDVPPIVMLYWKRLNPRHSLWVVSEPLASGHDPAFNPRSFDRDHRHPAVAGAAQFHRSRQARRPARLFPLLARRTSQPCFGCEPVAGSVDRADRGSDAAHQSGLRRRDA